LENHLSADEIQHFRAAGWVGAFPLLHAAGAAHVSRVQYELGGQFKPCDLSQVTSPEHFQRQPWFKSMHAYVPLIAEIAAHPAIVERVADLLGPDVMVWGTSTNVKHPGQTHRWHVDIETRRWRGITAFIGLENLTELTTLKVVSRSHLIGVLPQDAGITSDESAVACCKARDAAAELVPVRMTTGEFFLFDGLAWHGSHNASAAPRVSLIVQYAAPSAKIEIPVTWDPPVRWMDARPPCLLVKGEDKFGINRIVPPPANR